ncbi:ABC transporter ATP-binding protein [Lutibaculum baratangense]|uniref:Putative ATP-binding ABC transporter n=1 Tax=Lutibaculum baratangense AMV1 TaxID=631454 RepID=V4RGI1_9HYPH|nr:ABC transporter ATP-binding protein [Lutibaculum baratangense]ESR25266.1 putative ATP-binding ABC transporter [Lutibaculum baratangense AMV1]
MSVILETNGLSRRFGGLRAVGNVTFALQDGARQALIGPNGAGKTTYINLLTGVVPPSEGRITFLGEDITRLSPEARVRRGIVRTFQINQLFDEMTPLEAVALAVLERDGKARAMWRPLASHHEALDEAAGLLASLGLADAMEVPTAEISYGRRRLLEICVALACRPRLLLLDEPAAGVPEHERNDIMNTVANLPRTVSVLLIEHDMDLVFRFAERIAVLVGGELLVEGTPDEVANDIRVKEAYLGESLDAPAA